MTIPMPPGFTPAVVMSPKELAALLGEEPGFVPYSGAPSVQWPYVAYLGSIGGRPPLEVHTWKVIDDDTVEVIKLVDPPTNNATLFWRDDQLILYGNRGSVPTTWVIPGAVPPPVIDDTQIAAVALSAVLEVLKRPGTPIRSEVVQIVKEWTHRILRQYGLIPEPPS